MGLGMSARVGKSEGIGWMEMDGLTRCLFWSFLGFC